MTIPPRIPANKMRVFMGKLQRRNDKFERRKPAILVLALSRGDRHSRSSLSLTNPMKTPVLSLITALAIAAFFGCQSQKKEETTMSTGATTTHGTSTSASAKKSSTTKKTSASASAEASASASPAKKSTKKKAAAEESASPTASPSATP
jgi:cytoskeletal protein RodZ